MTQLSTPSNDANNPNSPRKLTRKQLNASLRVFDVKTGQRAGRLVDITLEGLMIVSTQPIEANETFHFSMVLPSEIKGTNRVSFTCESMWCKAANYSNHFGTGFKIIDMNKEDIDILELLIRGY